MRRPPSRCALPLLALCFAGLAGVGLAHAQTAGGGAVGVTEEQSSSSEAPAPEENALPAAGPADEAPVDGAVGEGLDDERARAHFFAGESHYAAGRFADAAREFALAYELSRRPEMLVNLARAHERDGALRAAVADLELLLLQHPTASYRGEAEQRLSELRQRLAPPPAADARLPSFDAAQTPQPTRERELTRLPAWPRYVLAVGAVASAAVALGSGVRAHDIYEQLETECPQNACDGPFEEDRDRGRALARASTGMTFAAVLLGGAAAALWLYDLRVKRQLALGARVDGSTAALHLRGRF